MVELARQRAPNATIPVSDLDRRGRWAVLVEVRPAATLLRHEIVTFREHAPGAFRRDEEIHVLTPHLRDDVLDTLRQLGCTAETLPNYAGVELPAGLIAILAVKRYR
jgi:hypothetical protein